MIVRFAGSANKWGHDHGYCDNACTTVQRPRFRARRTGLPRGDGAAAPRSPGRLCALPWRHCVPPDDLPRCRARFLDEATPSAEPPIDTQRAGDGSHAAMHDRPRNTRAIVHSSCRRFARGSCPTSRPDLAPARHRTSTSFVDRGHADSSPNSPSSIRSP